MKPTVISSLLIVPTLLIHAVLSATFDRPVPQVARQADQGITSCVPWLSLVESCTAATPSFESLPFSVRASCLCYSSSLWQPSVYDGALDTCLAYLATASPTYYSSIGGGTAPTDPCRLAGDVIATASTGSYPASPSPTMTTGASITSPSQPVISGACLSADLILASCALATSSFTNLPFTVEASCLCYTSGTYAPSVYDGYWAACLGFYSTASPVYYSSLGGDVLPRTPCARVEKIIGSTVPTVSSSTTNTPSPSALTTVVSIVTTQSGAPGLRIESYTWLITVGVCFLTLI